MIEQISYSLLKSKKIIERIKFRVKEYNLKQLDVSRVNAENLHTKLIIKTENLNYTLKYKRTKNLPSHINTTNAIIHIKIIRCI